MVTKTPELFLLVFPGVKERLKEAPFMPWKNCRNNEELQCTAGLAPNYYCLICFHNGNKI